MITKFNKYNENIKSVLTPKSDDDIKKALEGLSDYRKIVYGYDYDLPKEYLPENPKKILIDYIQNMLKEFEDEKFSDEIYFIEDCFENKPKRIYLVHNFLLDGIEVDTGEPVKRTIFKKSLKLVFIPYEDLSLFGLIKSSYAISGEMEEGEEEDDDMNENIKSVLTPKSDDKILKLLKGMTKEEIVKSIIKNKLPHKFLPKYSPITIKDFRERLKKYASNVEFLIDLHYHDILYDDNIEDETEDRITAVLKDKISVQRFSEEARGFIKHYYVPFDKLSNEIVIILIHHLKLYWNL